MLVIRKTFRSFLLAERVVMVRGQGIEINEERAAGFGGIGGELGVAIEAALEAITDTLTKGEAVQLIGFGSFSTGQRAARTGRNPSTGQAIEIAAATTVKFTAGKAFKDAVNV